jgi:hypothetical protein
MLLPDDEWRGISRVSHQYLLSGDGSQFNLQQRSMGISLGVTRVANQLPFLTDPKSRRLPLNGAVNSSGVAANYVGK